MAKVDWTKIGSIVANKAIGPLGGLATLRRQTSAGTLNPSTGQMTGKTEQTHQVSLVMNGRREFWRAGSIIKVWNESATMAVSAAVEPRTGDIIEAAGRRYVVGEVDTPRPDGAVAVVHVMELVA